MKTFNTLLIAFALLLASCQKQPVASFITDKTEYEAGDTVHLTNTSENGHSYIWTMPDGSKQTTKDATYIVDANVLYEKLTFQLEADSKHERKKGFAVKQVLATIKPLELINSFTMDNHPYTSHWGNSNPSAQFVYGDNWGLVDGTDNGGINEGYIRIFLPGKFSVDAAGIYDLQSDRNNIIPGKACILMNRGCPDCIPQGIYDHSYTSVAGKVVILVTKYGTGNTIQAVFNNVDGLEYGTNNIVKLSGNIATHH